MSLTRVVAANSAGNLYDIQQPNNSVLSGGNGGSVAKASSTDKLDGVDVNRYDSGVFGSTVVDNEDTAGATAGTFAYNNQSPIAKRVTKKINTANNSVLLSGASQPSLTQSVRYSKIEHPINIGEYLDGVKTLKTTTAIRGGVFNLYTGKFSTGYPESSNDYFLGIDTISGDKAAKPTRDVPGRLTYKGGAPNVVTTNYKKKTG